MEKAQLPKGMPVFLDVVSVRYGVFFDINCRKFLNQLLLRKWSSRAFSDVFVETVV
jgi:hypothetical protein